MVERAPGRPSGLPRNREPAGAQGSGQRLRAAMLREFAGGPVKAAEALHAAESGGGEAPLSGIPDQRARLGPPAASS